MNEKIDRHRVKNGIVFSLFAQLVSLAVSFLLNLIVPKFIDEYQYSYWQTYMLYIAYVGILHFGLLDGIVLRYSQYDYEELDKPRIRSQFQILLWITSFAAISAILVASFFCKEITKTIVILIAISIVSKNLFTYTSYSFQITNRINRYAFLVIAQRAFYGVGIVMLLLFGVEHFYWFCIFDLCSDLFGVLLGARYNKGLYFGRSLSLCETLAEAFVNVRSGIVLLIANWSSVFLVGSAKMMVQWKWDELVFGKVAFAFSVSNLFLTFVTAISVVLFPTLKRMDRDRLPLVYKSIRDVVSPLLFWAMLLYFPGCLILSKWLPAYQPSLIYLGLLLPIIIYTSKVSLLTNNYLKAYRRENSMLMINVASVLLAVTLFAVCAYLLESLEALLVSVVLVIMLRSILSELVVMRMIGIRFWFDFIVEAALTVGFIVCAAWLNLGVGCGVYFALLIGYSILYRATISEYLNKIKNKFLNIRKGKTA